MKALRFSAAKSALFNADWLEDCETFNDERTRYQFISTANGYRWRVRIKRSVDATDVTDGYFWTLDAAIKFRDGMLSGDMGLVDEAHANNRAARSHFKRVAENCFFFDDQERYNLSMHMYDYIYMGERKWKISVHKKAGRDAISTSAHRLATALAIRDAVLLGDKRALQEAKLENERQQQIYATSYAS